MYSDISELPEFIREALPESAQKIYVKAYNHASVEEQDASPADVADVPEASVPMRERAV